MKIYLAGPMRGIPKFNFPAFYEAAEFLKQQGHEVFNPASSDCMEHGPEVCESPTGNLEDIKHTGFSLRHALKKDLSWICDHAEAVALLPDWERSLGATAERALAVALGLDVIYL